MKIRAARRRPIVLAAFGLCLAGCAMPGTGGKGGAEMIGEERHESRMVERAKARGAELITAEITIAAGELRVSGGAKEMVEAEFVYNVPAWKPEVRFDESGFRRRLSISQSRTGAPMGDVKNRWDIKLAGDVPLDLTVRCGAGENRLDLRQVTLRSLAVHLGVGEVVVDLRGKPKRDLEAKINGGIGHALVLVPADVGLEASAAGGIGQIDVTGLRREEKRWVNDAFGKSPANIRLDVRGGIGQIEIKAE